MIAVVESVWEQIQNHGISKNNHVSNIRAKTALKFLATTFLILTLDSFYQSVKSIKTLRKLKNKCLILKPDKGQGIVLINKDDYNNSMENLFNGTRIFELLNHDPTIRNISIV